MLVIVDTPLDQQFGEMAAEIKKNIDGNIAWINQTGVQMDALFESFEHIINLKK